MHAPVTGWAQVCSWIAVLVWCRRNWLQKAEVRTSSERAGGFIPSASVAVVAQKPHAVLPHDYMLGPVLAHVPASPPTTTRRRFL